MFVELRSVGLVLGVVGDLLEMFVFVLIVVDLYYGGACVLSCVVCCFAGGVAVLVCFDLVVLGDCAGGLGLVCVLVVVC